MSTLEKILPVPFSYFNLVPVLFSLSSFSWLFTSHALSEVHGLSDLWGELRSFRRFISKPWAGSEGRSSRLNSWGGMVVVSVCVPTPTENIHVFWCVCVSVFLSSWNLNVVWTKSSSHATENKAAAHHSGPDWLAGTWATRSGSLETVKADL